MGVVFVAIIGLVAAAVGWIATEFFARPIRNFFTLRTEIRHEMLRLENVGAPHPDWTYPKFTEEAIEKLNQPSKEAQAIFRTLGTKLKAFDETEWPANTGVRILGFDPIAAAGGLIGLSNCYGTYGRERASHRETVRRGLRLPL